MPPSHGICCTGWNLALVWAALDLLGVPETRKSFLDTLAKHQVVQINPVDEPFNPEEHQAVTMVPNPDVEPNTVLEIFQKGYSLNGRLIRPAMVVVSKAAD